MSTIHDVVMRAYYNQVRNWMIGLSLVIFTVGLCAGYALEPLIPNLMSACLIAVVYAMMFSLKQRIARGSFPATYREHKDLNRWLRKRGGRVIRDISID